MMLIDIRPVEGIYLSCLGGTKLFAVPRNPQIKGEGEGLR